MIRIAKCKLSLIVVVLLLSAVVFGCTKPPLATKLGRTQRMLDEINRADGKVYLYKAESEFLSEHLKQFESIQTLEQVQLKNEFSMLAITKEYYDDMTPQFVARVFEMLRDFSNKLIVVWLDFPDLRFFKDTYYHNKWDNYKADNFAIYSYNFYNEISSQKGWGVSLGPNNEDADYDEHIIDVFEKELVGYNKSQ